MTVTTEPADVVITMDTGISNTFLALYTLISAVGLKSPLSSTTYGSSSMVAGDLKTLAFSFS